MALRVVFMGTPDFAVPALTEIVGAGHDVVAVYTQPPRPAGRGMDPKPSAVAQVASRFGIPVKTPVSFGDPDALAAFQALEADVGIVVAYGLILPVDALEAPRFGCLNLHASLLPRWRGAAPIQRAIMAGDPQTGVAVMKMEAGLDTGPVAMVEKIAIAHDMTAGVLHDDLARIGADLMHRALGALERGALEFTDQPGDGATYARKIEKTEARIIWSRPSVRVHDHIRGLSPFPGAWFAVGEDGPRQRVKVIEAEPVDGAGPPGTILDARLTVACEEGAIRPLIVQRAGRQPMPTDTFLKGFSIEPGTILD